LGRGLRRERMVLRRQSERVEDAIGVTALKRMILALSRHCLST
jgi:hypothetical protein